MDLEKRQTVECTLYFSAFDTQTLMLTTLERYIADVRSGKHKKAVEKVNPNVKAAKSVAEAVEEVKAMTTKDDVVIVFGSLSFLSLADEAWNR